METYEEYKESAKKVMQEIDDNERKYMEFVKDCVINFTLPRQFNKCKEDLDDSILLHFPSCGYYHRKRIEAFQIEIMNYVHEQLIKHGFKTDLETSNTNNEFRILVYLTDNKTRESKAWDTLQYPSAFDWESHECPKTGEEYNSYITDNTLFHKIKKLFL